MILHVQQPRHCLPQASMAPRAVLAALLLVAAAHLLSGAAAVTPLSSFQPGILTHYGGAQDGMDPNNPSFGSKEGSCGYGAIPKDRYPYFQVAALSPQNSFYKAGPLNGCGQCFEIQCQGKDCKLNNSGEPQSVVVMISDECPECEADHIDVQSLSFAKLANPAAGRIGIQYRRVECTPPSDMKVAVTDYRGAGGWIRLSIDDTGGRAAVKAVLVKSSSSGSWQPLKNSFGANWETGSSPTPPLDFKMVCDDGEEVVAEGVIKQNGGISGQKQSFSTGVQFTITNGGDNQQVVAFNGPPDSTNGTNSTGSSNSTGSTNSTGSPSPPATTASSPSPAGGCQDVPPPGSSPCNQWKDWNKCSDSWLTSNNYCAATCGRCGSGGTSGGQAAGSGEPKVQSFSGPPDSPAPPGGRKLLRGPQ